MLNKVANIYSNYLKIKIIKGKRIKCTIIIPYYLALIKDYITIIIFLPRLLREL